MPRMGYRKRGYTASSKALISPTEEETSGRKCFAWFYQTRGCGIEKAAAQTFESHFFSSLCHQSSRALWIFASSPPIFFTSSRSSMSDLLAGHAPRYWKRRRTHREETTTWWSVFGRVLALCDRMLKQAKGLRVILVLCHTLVL